MAEGGGGQELPSPVEPVEQVIDWELPACHSLVWGAGAPAVPPQSWLEQGFAFSGFAHDRLGLPQGASECAAR